MIVRILYFYLHMMETTWVPHRWSSTNVELPWSCGVGTCRCFSIMGEFEFSFVSTIISFPRWGIVPGCGTVDKHQYMYLWLWSFFLFQLFVVRLHLQKLAIDEKHYISLVCWVRHFSFTFRIPNRFGTFALNAMIPLKYSSRLGMFLVTACVISSLTKSRTV